MGDEVEIIIDGGIRRELIFLRQSLWGLTRVQSGAYLYGLAVNGEAGVVKALEIIREEFRRTWH